MNYFFTIIVAVMLAGAALGSELTAPSKFDAANAAYDRGDFNQAQQLYGELLAGDLASVEILYNAGNAAFRRGFPGQAVLFYRRAWYLAPRDADIKANLQLAQQRAGSLPPANGLIQRAAQELSQAEWVRIFKGFGQRSPSVP